MWIYLGNYGIRYLKISEKWTDGRGLLGEQIVYRG